MKSDHSFTPVHYFRHAEHWTSLWVRKLRRGKDYLGGHGSLHELDVVFAHVVADQFRTLLVKTTQQNRAHHHRRVKAEASQETSTLEWDVGGADTQSFARRVGQGEQVVTETRWLGHYKSLQPATTKLFQDWGRGGLILFTTLEVPSKRLNR